MKRKPHSLRPPAVGKFLKERTENELADLGWANSWLSLVTEIGPEVDNNLSLGIGSFPPRRHSEDKESAPLPQRPGPQGSSSPFVKTVTFLRPARDSEDFMLGLRSRCGRHCIVVNCMCAYYGRAPFCLCFCSQSVLYRGVHSDKCALCGNVCWFKILVSLVSSVSCTLFLTFSFLSDGWDHGMIAV